MSFRPKIWTRLGLGVAMIGLAACGGESGEAGEVGESGDSTIAQAAEETGETGEIGEAGEAGEAGQSEALALPERLAFMSGHVAAGLALYRAGEPEMAAAHLLHPVSEMHASERAGLDELGFDGSLFEAVSEALSSGKAASEINMQLLAAEANLATVAERAGGDTVATIKFLMDTVVNEYSVGVPAAKVEVAGEYQDAYGFAVVALDRAGKLDGEAGQRVRAELLKLIALWPEAPVPPEVPAPASAVRAQVSAVLLELP